jgi:hypothetical protein
MSLPNTLVAAGVSGALFLAGFAITAAVHQSSDGLGPAVLHPDVLYPAGTVLHFPEARAATFTVPSWGGWIVGRADVDHFTDFEVLRSPWAVACPAMGLNATYIGSPWTFSIDEHLTGGTWYLGPVCYDYVNVTVTEPIVVL